MEKLKGYSICSGIGGLDIAFQSEYIGGQTIGYCEYDTYCQNVLWRRMQDGWLDNAAIWPDLYTLEKSIVGHVDVLYGGIPCQPHSQAGKRAGADDPRDLWPNTLELLREVRPRLFFLENVTGITMGTGQQGAYVYRIFDDLCKIGYEFRWTTVRASDIGAPHRRERFFLLAYSNSTRGQSLKRDRMGNEYTKSKHPIQFESESGIVVNTYDPLGSEGKWIGLGSEHRQSGSQLGNTGDWIRSTRHAINDSKPGAYDIPDDRSHANGSTVGEVDITEGLFQSFPPSPDSQDEWRGLIRRNASLSPAIEPNLRRGPDGLTPGLDKYRRKGLAALGNGVVPQQAILAWLLLKRNL
mgnify:CR=1 FL=1